MQNVALLALTAWLVIYGLVLARRVIVAYRRAVRIFDDTHADDIGAYIEWLSTFTYWTVIFGVGCGLLTFLIIGSLTVIVPGLPPVNICVTS